MNARLRRRYQRLLLTYPPAYRAAHGDEIVSTLLDAAGPTQRFPSWREAVSLLLGGLRTRAREAANESSERVWSDGLRLGVLLIVLVNLGTALRSWSPLWMALVALGALAVLRAWTVTALIATAIAALAAARPLLPAVSLPWWLPGYGDWSAVGRYALPVAVLVVLARRAAGRPRARSWWWLLLPAVQAVLPRAQTAWSLVEACLLVVLVLAVLMLTRAALDPRPAIAAAVYLAPGLLAAAETVAQQGALSSLWLAYWTALAALAAGLVGVAMSISRQQRAQP